MKMRKLFAGIAAAATMLGGLALGATTANAADETPLLQVNNAQEGHTYTPYRFATLKAGTNTSAAEGNKPTLEVTTVDGWKTIVAAAADASDGAATKPVWFNDNPAAYVATFTTDKEIRDFASNLVAEYNKAQNKPAAVQGGALTITEAQKGQSVAFPETVTQGWYLVTDTWTKKGETEATAGTPAVVATTVNGLAGSFKVSPVDKVTGQGNIEAVGQFNAKNENPGNPPVKTSDDTDKSVYAGQEITYTITTEIPANAGNYDPYKLVVKDAASKGLQIPTKDTTAADGGFTAFVDADGDGVKDGDDTDLTVDFDKNHFAQTGGASDANGTTTTITFDNVKDYAGKSVTVKYTATVTADAEDKVSNTASVDRNGTGEVTGEKVEKSLFSFQFTKVKKGGAVLDGAKFVVKHNGKYLKDTAGVWSFVDSQADATEFAGVDGVFSFDKVEQGDYEVIETSAPSGYASNFLAHFTVTVGETGAVTLKTSGATNAYSLADQDETTNKITVLNVTSITQLPLTGAAGTALFSVIAVLLAGAAATVYAKSRNTKRMLNA